MRFIYVTDEQSKDKLLRAGFKLLKEDNKNYVWIFSNNGTYNFNACEDFKFVLSDVMSF